MRTFRATSPTDRVAGRAWYARARELAAELAASLPAGHRWHGDVERAAAVIAAVSPLISWTLNVRYARALYAAACLPGATIDTVAPAFRGLGSNGRKAAALLVTDGATLDILRGPKVVPFFHTIVHPDDALTIVIDRHAVDIAVGRVTDDVTRSTLLARKASAAATRNAYARAAAIATRETGETWTPADIQATTWVAWRRTRIARVTVDAA